MTSPYKAELLRLAQEELPFLQADMQNASTLYALQACCQRLFNVTANIIYCILTDEVETPAQAKPQVAAQRPVRAPQAAPRQVVRAPVAPSSTSRLPPPPFISQPNPVATQVGIPDAQGATVQPGVTNVIIGQQGTTVIAPSGAQTVLPPGEAVDLAASMGTDPEPPMAPEGVENIILPKGGGFTPDVMAALANRTGMPPQEPDGEIQEA